MPKKASPRFAVNRNKGKKILKKIGKFRKKINCKENSRKRIWKQYLKLLAQQKQKLKKLLVVFLILLLGFGLGLYVILLSVMKEQEKIPETGVLNETFRHSRVWDYFSKEPKKRLQSRQDLLQERCEELDRKKDPFNYHDGNADAFFIIDKYNITWCSVLKAASSSWMYVLHLLKRKSYELEDEEIGVRTSGRKDYKTPTVKELEGAAKRNGALTFIVIRHPFERLVSAYRDTILNAKTESEFDILRRKIVWEYREWDSKIKDKNPTFREFVKYVGLENRIVTGARHHFIPYSKSCATCLVKYDFIMKQETLKSDMEYFLKLTNLTIFENVTKIWQNLGRRMNSEKGKTTAELAKAYFSSLKLSEVTKLYEIFQDDFYLFDYDPSEYFKIADHGDPVENVIAVGL